MQPQSSRISGRHDRTRELRKLLEHALSVARSGSGDGVPSSARLAATLASFRLDVAIEGAFLSVRVTETLELSIDVWMTVNWGDGIEGALRAAVVKTGSPLVGLVLAEWARVCDACRTAALLVRETSYEPAAAVGF